MLCLFLLALGSHGHAEALKNYRWGGWEVKKKLNAHDSSWVIKERVQGVSYSPWHISRWLIWQNYSGYSGSEIHLVNEPLGFDENILELIFFPQKDGSYKPLLNKPFINKHGRVDYHGAVGVYEKDGALQIWLNPDSETGTHRPLPPYTDCGFLTAKEKVAYATDRRHEPEVYHGEFDPKTRKFHILYTSAPIQYVYWSEWGSMTSPFLEDRSQYRKPSVWDDATKKYVPGALEVRPEYVYLGKVENVARLPVICNEDDYIKAKSRFQLYLKNIWQPAIERESSRMSGHEKATLRREECNGIGLNYDFGCKQIDDYGRNDGSKNVFPKDVKLPRVEERPDGASRLPRG